MVVMTDLLSSIGAASDVARLFFFFVEDWGIWTALSDAL